MGGGEAIYRGYDQEQLDFQYSPRLQVPDHLRYSDAWTANSAKVRASGTGRLDIAYGPGATDLLDIFPAAGKGGRAPVAIFFHGGYWRSFSKNDFAYLAPYLTAEGALVAIPEYALCPTVTMDELIAQCRRAVVWVSHNIAGHGGDPAQTFIVGHSAGGHITAMMMSTDWQAEGLAAGAHIAGAFAISGLYDLEPFPKTFLQADVRLTPEQVERNSPLRHVRKVPAPNNFILAVGSAESEEFHRQAETYSDAWATVNARCDIIHEGGTNHYTVLDAIGVPDSLVRLGLLRMMNL